MTPPSPPPLPEKAVYILDLGCGTGQSSVTFFNTHYKKQTSDTTQIQQQNFQFQHEYKDSKHHSFSSTVFKVIGVDATEEMLDQARRLPFTELHCLDIEKPLPFDEIFHAAGFFLIT